MYDRGYYVEDLFYIVVVFLEYVLRYFSLGFFIGWFLDWDVSINSLLGNMEVRWGRKGN